MSNETLFGVKNPLVQPLQCRCGGQGWLATMLHAEMRSQDKLILLCAECQDNWLEVIAPNVMIPADDETISEIELGGLALGGNQ